LAFTESVKPGRGRGGGGRTPCLFPDILKMEEGGDAQFSPEMGPLLSPNFSSSSS